VFWPWPAEIPFDTIVALRFLPMWIILVPVSACCRLFVTAPIELAHGVVALEDAGRVLPRDRGAVSICVQEIFDFLPRQAPRLVTKL